MQYIAYLVTSRIYSNTALAWTAVSTFTAHTRSIWARFSGHHYW
uniref:Uncharacterized protein n=1 Tax=Anguilla anguilla TaxID=7936 RepID=A0A0E9TBE7_ANGAN